MGTTVDYWLKARMICRDTLPISGWLQVNSPLGRPEQAFYVQVTEITPFGKVVAGHYKFSRDWQRFPMRSPKLVARPCTEEEARRPRPPIKLTSKKRADANGSSLLIHRSWIRQQRESQQS